MENVHVDGTARIAEAVAKYDVDRFIHVSSYNADPNSPATFFRTKGRGEQVARSIFPETTIVRPAPTFGFEDNLLLKLAGVTNLFTSNHMQERYWPVHSIDIGHALELMLYDDNTASQTYELYGPNNYSTAEIAEMVDREIFTKRKHINVPRKILEPVAHILNKLLWWPIMSREQIEVEHIDQVIDENAKTFKDLGIEPGEISKFTYHYVVSLDPTRAPRNPLDFRDTDCPCSKDSAAVRSTTCHQRARRRRGRKRSICTLLKAKVCKRRRQMRERVGFGVEGRAAVRLLGNCKYATRFSCVLN